MNRSLALSDRGEIQYPESDGKPMSDNTRQFRWIVMLFGNLAAWFRNDPNVFVSGNQNWYPVEGEPGICQAPDVYVVFGRPKGDRGSYKQWEEGGIPMTVVFEVLSPSNDYWDMADKLEFYDHHGVEEYFIYDPDKNSLDVYLRRGTVLRRVRPVDGFVSPRLGIRFQMKSPEMTVLLPDGRRFLAFEEIQQHAEQAEQRAGEAEQRAGEAEQRAGEAEQQVGEAEQRIHRLVELSRKARRGQATPEELEELDRTEG